MFLRNLLGFVGYGGMLSGFLCSVFIISLSTFSLFTKTIYASSARIASVLQTIALSVSVLSLGTLMQLNAFEYVLVYESIEVSMPWFQKLGGLWAGQSSSILFWSLIMSGAALLGVLIIKKIPNKKYLLPFLFIFQFILIFFIIPNLFFNNPFEKIWIQPDGSFIKSLFFPKDAQLVVLPNGVGLNPSLRHIAMQLHPPIIYGGMIGFFIPYAFALSALIINDKEHLWIELAYPITLISWVLLTIGIVLGSWWAYTILGWGGYWGWDAVEISGLLPWILSFGLIHSMSMYLRGHPHKKWIYILSVFISLLILFGILLTRSGLIESVHAYAQGVMGPVLTGLIIINIISVLFLMVRRWKMLGNEAIQGDEQPLTHRLVNLFNVILVILTILYLYGQTLPLTSQLILGKKFFFSPIDYKSISAPVLLVMVVVTALFPNTYIRQKNKQKYVRILKWMITISALCPALLLVFTSVTVFASVGFWAITFLIVNWLYLLFLDIFFPIFRKKARKNKSLKWVQLGSIIIHLAFGVLCIGILSVENFSTHQNISLRVGETISIESYEFSGTSLHQKRSSDGSIGISYHVDMRQPNGNMIGFVPEINYLTKFDSFYSEPEIHTNLLRDIQLVMDQTPDLENRKANLKINIFPLMSWIWFGSILMVIGGLITIFFYRRISIKTSIY